MTRQKMTTANLTGIYGGGRVGFYEHEVSSWIRSRLRVNTGEPAASPLAMPDNPRIISVREAEERTGFSRVHLWRLERDGLFPARVRLSHPLGRAAT
jgi:predicted DNA-binding transcriptional regulator AlpA